MSPVRFSVNPKELADVLANAYEIGHEKSGVEPLPHIMLAYQPAPGGKVGMVVAYGVGRYASGRAHTNLIGLPSKESAVVCIDRDTVYELQKALRAVLGGKKAIASVAMSEEPFEVEVKDENGMPVKSTVNLYITAGEQPIADLLDSDPAGKTDKWFDLVDELLATAKETRPGPVAFSVDVLSRLAKIRGGHGVLDFNTTANPDVVAVALGGTFRGLIGEVNRTGYAAGGANGDGPGSTEHLLF